MPAAAIYGVVKKLSTTRGSRNGASVLGPKYHKLMLLRVLFFAVALCSTGFADAIEAFGYKWTVPVAADWKVTQYGGGDILTMLVERPQEKPRRPKQFALAETRPFKKVTIEVDVKRIGKSLILVYAWQDDSHFNYVHLSSDAPKDQPVHNGIFHVYGGDRVRISPLEGPGSLASEDWTKVKVVHDGSTGTVTAWVNGQTSPSLKGIDLSLTSGKVGLGSFFEKAEFRNLTITGEQ